MGNPLYEYQYADHCNASVGITEVRFMDYFKGIKVLMRVVVSNNALVH